MKGFSAYRCPSRADRTRVLSLVPLYIHLVEMDGSFSYTRDLEAIHKYVENQDEA